MCALVAGGLALPWVAVADHPHAANREGLRHFAEERYAEAEAAFARGAALPQTPVEEAAVLAFNRGLAALRLEAAEGATDAFEQAMASPDPRLRAAAAYAAGNAWARRAGEGGEDPAALEQAIAHLDRALGWYEKALEADGSRRDASANHELAYARREQFQRKLEELRKQQETQQQDSQDQGEDKEKPEDQKPEEPKSEDKEEKGDSEGKDSPPQKNPPGEGNPSGQGEAPPPPEPGGEPPPSPGEESPENPQPETGGNRPAQPEDRMTPEQAEMLLNAMLNDERRQREAARLLLMKPGPDIPVEKDY
jgi:tetratricopeptide (TPR) repeat protein